MADLTCRELVELVSAYLDQELDPETTARFEAHLDACAGCATYLDQFRETIDLLGYLEEASLSEQALSEMRLAFREWAS